MKINGGVHCKPSNLFLFFIMIKFVSEVKGQPLPVSIFRSRDRRSTSEAGGENKFDSIQIVPSNYNKHLAPPITNNTPIHCEMAVLIVNVRDIKDLTEELTLEVNMKMAWKDVRLQHLGDYAGNNGDPFLVLNPKMVDSIWHPDIYVDHVKTITQPSIASKPASLRVYPDSIIRYSTRLTLAQSCPMDFHFYPADTQRCPVDIMSYAYNDGKLNLKWKKGKSVSFASKIYLPNLDVGMDPPENFVIQTNSGNYTGIRFVLLLRRKLSYHLLQTYLPSTLFVFVSWQSFLIPPDCIPGRMALCMTTLLTLTTMFSTVRQGIPNVSYIKALDVWMVSCIVFVFLTLLEYTTLLKLKLLGEQTKCGPKRTKTGTLLTLIGGHGNAIITATAGIKNGKKGNIKLPFNLAESKHNSVEVDTPLSSESGSVTGKMMVAANSGLLMSPSAPELQCLVDPAMIIQRVESVTSRIIPSLFIFFNIIYWPWLLYYANYYRHFSTNIYY